MYFIEIVVYGFFQLILMLLLLIIYVLFVTIVKRLVGLEGVVNVDGKYFADAEQ